MKAKRCVNASCKLKAKLVITNNKVKVYECNCGFTWSENIKIMEKKK